MTCAVNQVVPILVRAEGLTELAGDIVVVCSGGRGYQAVTVSVELAVEYLASRKISPTNPKLC